MFTFNQVIPIVRIFDEKKAKEFYVDYLGFQIDWEHRFETNLPLYIQISRDTIVIHLTEHHGDCCPGSAFRMGVSDIKSFHKQLLEKEYNYLRPAIERTPWNSNEMRLIDPFGNRITLFHYDE
ncbi:VOC family protein [Paenibacillus sp. GSMTC-2017]|uniref:glyoxalase superfamily protein n=1 Tax=Paenibacillus sp. GSMTC-2017 TaxID=2794350 RepID=UPI0018D9F564|nr:glyoxalase superfamily protein [Paenibacillus sp. GSMTC-2017]MBH5316222.1 VOC family protein [Paenibacillus sp. GSMTC-2017]